ncbi:RNA methyltransferase [Halopenitus persicus]|uniref:RNA methyltransferase, TrmH family, group 1 n=1 Tax=Halopenitus persicus TaxID=1048396 RepID=A0A1H3KM33_9EURY|nr:RNA methyltransferase [Halopenitus persicus]SDY53212.1 RNA methyltransferase, TrmH family, group 1 [Halopenitus persicus]
MTDGSPPVDPDTSDDPDTSGDPGYGPGSGSEFDSEPGSSSDFESGSGPRSTDPVVVVVEPETPGNVGTIARAMKNFGLTDLKLVDPPELEPDGEAYGFAGHAREDVLPNAETVTFEEVVETYHTVGCTAITGEDARRHVRFPYSTPVELRESLRTVETRTALVFGREGTGLDNDELRQLDEVCSIPADEDYPVLNLGQAATVLLYELRELTVDEYQLPDVELERASEADIERLHDYFERFLDHADHREYRRDRCETLFRRLLGRAHPTDREVHTLLGVFRKATDKLEFADELAETYGESLYDEDASRR